MAKVDLKKENVTYVESPALVKEPGFYLVTGGEEDENGVFHDSMGDLGKRVFAGASGFYTDEKEAQADTEGGDE